MSRDHQLHTHSAPVQREGDLPEEQHVHSSPVNPPEDLHIHSASVQRECDPPLNNDSDGPLVTDEELFTTAELDKYLLFQFPDTSPLPDYSMLETPPVHDFDTLLYSPISVAPTPNHRETHYNVLEMPIHTSDEVTERGEVLAPPLFNAPDISETTPDFDTPRYSPISEAPTPNQETHDNVSPIQDSDEVTFLVEHLSSPPFVTPGVPLSSVEREVFLAPPTGAPPPPPTGASVPPTSERFVTGLPFPKGQATTRPRLRIQEDAHKNAFWHRAELAQEEGLKWSLTLVDTLSIRLHDASLEDHVDSPVDLSRNFNEQPLNLTRVR
ncbi:hypothetical protein JTE90_002582 [Oedothorax gibbosus]|uniref:Uncharacterized protein n=1 Tax=Oedothorax gibbosus TaxID=931172 RepID=A0AAV6TT22_9ARAC|nr:hypothetical protein JTE90_002582 [Oedothorax gibbosus]